MGELNPKQARKNSSQNSTKNSGKRTSQMLPILFLMGAGFFLLLSVFQSDPQSAKGIKGGVVSKDPAGSKGVDVHSEEYSQRVNSHLKMTEQKMRQQEQTMAIENHKARMRNAQSDEIPPEEATVRNPPSGFETLYAQDEQGSDLPTKIRGAQHAQETSQDPADTIQLALFQEQIARESSEAFKKKYAEAFVEKAKKQGVEIRLSADYRILSVRKFTVKTGPSLFEE